jgi:repressor LexA
MKMPLEKKEIDALRALRNYFMHNGRFPTIRELQKSLGYKSTRSAYLLLNKLIQKGAVKKKADGNLQLITTEKDESYHAQTVDIPLVGVVSCGIPILAQENIEAMIPVSIKLARPSFRYFLLRASGDSMNEAGINNGDTVLVRQQATAENGDIVVALIDDSATIKQYYFTGDTILLKPKSDNPVHRPIVLTSDFMIQGIVVTTIPNLDF